eukprot:SAG31_NODE_3788_length_3881_cov_1.735590_1_plen_292_part_00
MSKLQCSALTQSLLNTKMKVGEYSVDVFATWMHEMESGVMSPEAALFWSEHAEYLQPTCEVSEVLEEMAEEGLIGGAFDHEEVDFDTYGDCECVRQGIELSFPLELFESAEIEQLQDSAESAADPQGTRFGSDATLPLAEFVRWKLPADAAAKLRRARQRLCWASASAPASGSPASVLPLDILLRVGENLRSYCDPNTYFSVVDPASPAFFPEPGPCIWCYSKGWKGSGGSVTVKVEQPMTLGEFLQRELSANVGWIGDELFCDSFDINGEDPSWEEYNCKCADMVVAPPA